MARRLIAATLSLSLGLTGLAPAPALAQQSDPNMGRLIGGLVALGVIGAAAKLLFRLQRTSGTPGTPDAYGPGPGETGLAFRPLSPADQKRIDLALNLLHKR